MKMVIIIIIMIYKVNKSLMGDGDSQTLNKLCRDDGLNLVNLINLL